MKHETAYRCPSCGQVKYRRAAYRAGDRYMCSKCEKSFTGREWTSSQSVEVDSLSKVYCFSCGHVDRYEVKGGAVTCKGCGRRVQAW